MLQAGDQVRSIAILDSRGPTWGWPIPFDPIFDDLRRQSRWPALLATHKAHVPAPPSPQAAIMP